MRLPVSRLAIRITAFIAGSTALALLAIGMSNNAFLTRVSENRALDELRSHAQNLAPYAANAFSEIERDLEIVHLTPPIQGLIRSTRSGGIDPFDGSSESLWRRRLETIFASFLEARPEYTQIRYIGFGDEGRELVRVDNVGGQITIISDELLQSKAHRDYVATARSMTEGQIAFSGVTRNLERGEVQATDPPTLRAFMPVHSETGEAFGLLIINADFFSLARKVAGSAASDNRLTLVTQNGSIYTRQDDEESFFLGDDLITGHGALLHRIEQASAEERTFSDSFDNAELTTAFVDLDYGRSPHQRRIRIASTVPTSQIYADAAAFRKTEINVAILILAIVALLSLAFGRYLTQPLLALNQAINKFDSDEGTSSLPVGRSDELGLIARSFVKLEQRLLASKDAERRALVRMEAVMEQTIDSYISIDSSGAILSFNPAAEAEFGYTEEEILGQNVRLLMPEPERSQHDGYLLRFARSGLGRVVGQTREVQAQRKNGSVFTAELSISKVSLDNDEHFFTGIVRNVSKRKQAEQALNRTNATLASKISELGETNKKLDQANNELRNFTYIISHDLSAPLVNMRGFAGLLKSHVNSVRTICSATGVLDENRTLRESIEEKIPMSADYIEKAVEKMQEQVEAVLRASKLGRYEFNPRPVNLEITATSILSAHLGAEWSDIASIQVSGSPIVMIDENAARIILNNLCSNANKYASPDRAQEIRIGIESNRNGTTISVADNGRGMSENDMQRMYDMFTRCGRPDTEGLGIGLTYTKTLVDRMNGQIECDSKEGVGTTFTVFLPAEYCAPQQEVA